MYDILCLFGVKADALDVAIELLLVDGKDAAKVQTTRQFALQGFDGCAGDSVFCL